MDTPGLPVPHDLLEFAQVHVHWIGNAIQLSNPVILFFCLQQKIQIYASDPEKPKIEKLLHVLVK